VFRFEHQSEIKVGTLSTKSIKIESNEKGKMIETYSDRWHRYEEAVQKSNENWTVFFFSSKSWSNIWWSNIWFVFVTNGFEVVSDTPLDHLDQA